MRRMSGGGANIVNAPLPRGSKTEAFKSAVLDCLHRLREWGPESFAVRRL